MKKLGLRLIPVLAALSLTPTVVACGGHTEEEWQVKLHEIDALNQKYKRLAEQQAKTEQDYADAQRKIEDLKAKLQQAGVDYESNLKASEAEKNKLKNALSAYEARLKQLDEMKKQFKDLKDRLMKLSAQGLKVVVRKNRMVIQLPGDVLFASGEAQLQPEGKRILKGIADVINGDDTLRQRQFQVAGHTDNVEYPRTGIYKDNWGLSLARAHTVLLFLTHSPDAPKTAKAGDVFGGGLDPKNWAAAGYGAVDPIAGSVEKQSNDDMKHNRRVELVLQPNVEEMLSLDLKDFPE